jgi:2-methylisocitrate lyase-like PEP mutase family enzyme
VVELAEAVGKIEAAVAARRDSDFIIIARTDSAAGHGLDEAIRRCKAFVAAGADVAFAELKMSPTIFEDIKRVTGEVGAPCLANIAGGKLAALTAPQLEALGLRIAIYPGLGRNAAGYALREAMRTLKRDGNLEAMKERMLTGEEYAAAIGLADVEAWEQRYLK